MPFFSSVLTWVSSACLCAPQASGLLTAAPDTGKFNVNLVYLGERGNLREFQQRLSTVALQRGESAGSIALNNTVVPMRIVQTGGSFRGERFLRALLEDLDEDTVEKVRDCSFYSYGNAIPPPRQAPARNVWILLNGEDTQSDEALTEILPRLARHDAVLILGNRFNKSDHFADVKGERWSSMWVPFASTSFCERQHHTPMDLINRGAESRLRPRRGALAYLNSNCQHHREHVFDVLAERLEKVGLMASAMGQCHGERHPAMRWPVVGLFGDRPGLGERDNAAYRFQEYDFAVALEHWPSKDNGYITEKIVNAFLAGAVPIASNDRMYGKMFNHDAWIGVDERDLDSIERAAEEVILLNGDRAEFQRKVHTPAVSDKQMKRFFSWHPAVWPTHGDELRQRIWKEIVRLCKETK